ncbi:DUF2254 domain-containing protein [Oleiagrimonas citrea]|jgi:uncharacterized membrane protein|uniref:DUF2254 domain-containing protein n=1 Tax=Oleiagrimonas citrea TaxID=1665687 RepID=A0A846ZLT6_9GAMM|nr:DUF2254 domain-containing protein [Oleiagrimonas citrea]NKZ38782.1 DUF2254 domain-containing protein [Oleiagrimonas citrea]
MNRIRLWLDTLRTSLWFVPTLIVLASVVLAYALLAADAALPPEWWKHYGAGVNAVMDVRIRGATAILQMIGTSIITIAGVVFSITIAAFTLAAGQYTSRVLRNFIGDRGNQTVLGSFLGIFIYCMLVLRSLSSASDAAHAPALALLMAMVLAFFAIGILIYFIHHIAIGLQATNVVAAIARDALPSIDHHFPERFAPPEQDNVDLERPQGEHRSTLRAHRSGYLTGVSYAALAERAEACKGWIRVYRNAGEFVAEGEALAELVTPEPVEDERIDAMRAVWSFGDQRTLANDPGYGLRQLVDVALKALSPGVNETTTGVMCVNWIGVMLLRMAERRLPAQMRVRDGCIRVITQAPQLGDFIALGFDQIRQNASGNVAILRRLLEVLLALSASVGAHKARKPILRQVEAIEAMMHDTVRWDHDAEPLRKLLDTLRERLEGDTESHAEGKPAGE